MATQAITSLLWFVLILAAIPAVLWLVKRSPMGARFSSAAPGGAMRNVSTLVLSANQRIVTVEVGHGDDRRWLVIGVTAQQITVLHTMPPQADLAVVVPGAPGAVAGADRSVPFAQWLGKFRRESGPPGKS